MSGITVLVVNAGSSTLKLRLVDGEDHLVAASDPEGALPDAAALAAWVATLGPIDAVGHRVVHGGTEYVRPTLVDDHVLARLHALTDLAPLHQPKALAALAATTAALPGVPSVACFDTAFHAGIPAAAATYAIPPEWRQRWHLRRFGFHGISHAYTAQASADLLGRPLASLRLVSCHLGAGASLAAVAGGRCVDTTMGFTPLEGLVMATRSGNVDPGLILWLQTNAGLSATEVTDALEHRSGLLGLGGSADMAEVLIRSEAGNPDARLALAVYCHRLRALIAAMAASMGGLDALTFTGGVGENAPAVRAQAAEGLGFLGIGVDPAANLGKGDRQISPPEGRTPVLVTHTREDLQIARDVRRVLAG